MKPLRLFRFQLWQLLLVVVVLSGALWGVTEYGMKTGEIEVVEFDTYQDDGQNSVGVILTGMRFRYLRPTDQQQFTAQVFLRDFRVENGFEIGDRIVFRYRAKPLLWLKQDNPNDIALGLLGLGENQNYNLIIESGDR